MALIDSDLIQSVIQHMNEDHAAAVLLYVQVFAGVREADMARLEDMDTNAMRISYRNGGKNAEVWVPFERPVETAEEIRAELVRMAKAGRELLDT